MNYSYSWTDYIAQLHALIQQQEQKIQALEQRVEKLENAPSKQTTIEKIDYHFDQLKIERLDGTLHIGVNPEQLSDIDDWTVNQNQTSTTNSNHPQRALITRLDNYVAEEGPELLKQLAANYQRQPGSYNEKILLEDIRKQLPDRVEHYYKQMQPTQPANRNDVTNDIYEKIKEEILTSLQQFFQNQT